jgi:hypothetical protein
MLKQKVLIFVFLCLSCWALAGSSLAQENLYTIDFVELSTKQQMVDSIIKSLSICRSKSTKEFFVRESCRKAIGGCDQRISLIVDYILIAAEKNNLNPWLLASVAYNESRFNPFVKGQCGEYGIFQLNPKSKRGKLSRFVQDARYRRLCRQEQGNCQQEIVDFAADQLRSSIDKCNGSLVGGLSMYNGGTCKPTRKKYVYNTKKIWKTLLNQQEAIDKSIPWC